MILIISPAKTLDFDPSNAASHSQPRLLPQSSKLVGLLRRKSHDDLRQLMSISDQLAELNVERYQKFHTPFTPANAKQAILAFKGDVYAGLGADDFDEADLDFAQQHIRILSGLYGLLRPLDLMQAYRLEMGTKLQNPSGKNLYEFWGDTITQLLNDDLDGHSSPTVVNLASKEYFSAIKPDQLKGTLYDVQFKEKKGDTYKIIAFHAKKARGMMCRFAVQHRLEQPEDLKHFTEGGYAYNEGLSGERSYVFTR